MLRLGLLTLALLVGLLGTHVAHAQAPAAAEVASSEVDALLEQGVSLREQGRDDEAVTVFRRARAIDDSPRVQTQLGLALLASGQFVESFELLSGALASHDPWVEARRDAIQVSFDSASEHVGVLEITGGEPGAEVSVNGRVVGALPLTRATHVLVGRAVVEVSLEGYHRFSTEIAIATAQPARLRVALVPRVEETSGGGSNDWVLPLAIVGGALVLGGAVTGLVLGLEPHYEHADVGSVVYTLELP